jgi:hypothetical protein
VITGGKAGIGRAVVVWAQDHQVLVEEPERRI